MSRIPDPGCSISYRTTHSTYSMSNPVVMRAYDSRKQKLGLSVTCESNLLLLLVQVKRCARVSRDTSHHQWKQALHFCNIG